MHIMHIMGMLTNVTKGTQSITEYMQHVKSVDDEFAMLDALENPEYLTIKILNGKGDDSKTYHSPFIIMTLQSLLKNFMRSLSILRLSRNKKPQKITSFLSLSTMLPNPSLVVINPTTTEPTTTIEPLRSTLPIPNKLTPPLISKP